MLLGFANFDSKLDFVLSDEILQGQEIIIGLDLCFGSVGVSEEDGDGVVGMPEEEGSFVGDAGEGRAFGGGEDEGVGLNALNHGI